MKKFSISLFVGVMAAIAATAPAQMISTQYAKKLILADASASLVPLTLKAPAALAGAYSLTFPNSTPIANGYLLSAATDGTLSWVDPTSYSFLTGVSHNATLTGNGTSGSPLSLDLSNNNTWTGVQTLPVNSTQGNALVASVNAASNTINAASVGIGLTDAQVNNNLTISGGSITNSPIENSAIGATNASTGRFTTITGTSLPASSTSTNIVTSNGGALETRTATTANTASTLVLRDGSGNFSAGTITANLSGNATTATTATSSGSFSGSLSGDVTGTQAATAVALVGGSTAANVHTAELAANAATNANTPSTIVKRDATGNFTAGTITAGLTGNASTATTLQTTRSIYGNNFNGSADLNQVIASTFGGTGNGFTKFAGPATSEKTFTLPNASATILTDNAAITIAQGGTNSSTPLNNGKLMVSSAGKIVEGTSSSAPSFTSATLSGTTNQLVLGTTNTITITAPAPGGTRTYTLDDAGANAKFAITSATPITDRMPKWNGITGNLTNSSITDNGSSITTSEVVSISANSGSGNDGLSVSNTNSAGSALSATSSGTGDGVYAVKGSVTANAASASNELMGVWGIASGGTSTSLKTIGVRAEGNATTTAANTNTALSVLEGGINIGRQGTTATNNGGTDLVNNSGEDDATAADKGPSGVVTFASAIAGPGNASVTTGTQTVFNIYATSTSIILPVILNTDDSNVKNTESISVTIEGRAAGQFTIRVYRNKPSNGGTAPTSWSPKVGYLIINAAK